MASPKLKRVLVVEGRTDLHIILYILRNINTNITYNKHPKNPRVWVVRGIHEKPDTEIEIEIREEGGIDSLCKEIEVRLREEKLERIGFVFDADNDPNARWKQVRNEILKAYEELPTVDSSVLKKDLQYKPVSGGVWVKRQKPEIGMWMMPNNKDAGAIENFLEHMVYPDDYRWGRAQNYVNEVIKDSKKFSKFKIFDRKNTLKANIHAWLAVQNKPTRFLGRAIESGDFNLAAQKAQPFRQWLEGF